MSESKKLKMTQDITVKGGQYPTNDGDKVITFQECEFAGEFEADPMTAYSFIDCKFQMHAHLVIPNNSKVIFRFCYFETGARIRFKSLLSATIDCCFIGPNVIWDRVDELTFVRLPQQGLDLIPTFRLLHMSEAAQVEEVKAAPPMEEEKVPQWKKEKVYQVVRVKREKE